MSSANIIIDGDAAAIVCWFLIYSVLGWIWESAYRSIRSHRLINSGFLTGPAIPIYGFGALLYIVLLHLTLRPVELFFLGGIIACALEYATSFLLEKIFHARWWNYDKSFLNINGRVCLLGFIAFASFAALFPYMQLLIGNFVSIWPTWLRISFAIVTTATMLADAYSTSASVAKFNRILKRYSEALAKHAPNVVHFLNTGKKAFLMHFTHGEHRDRKVLTFQQRRILNAFQNFTSTEYPEAFTRIVKLYERANKELKDHQYKPTKK